MTLTAKDNKNSSLTNNHSARKKINLTWPQVNKILAVIGFCLMIIFIISVNDLSIQGFALQEMKNKTAELEKINEDMNIRIANLSSYENISKRASALKMVKVDRIDYISVNEAVVAKK